MTFCRDLRIGDLPLSLETAGSNSNIKKKLALVCHYSDFIQFIHSDHQVQKYYCQALCRNHSVPCCPATKPSQAAHSYSEAIPPPDSNTTAFRLPIQHLMSPTSISQLKLPTRHLIGNDTPWHLSRQPPLNNSQRSHIRYTSIPTIQQRNTRNNIRWF